MMSQYELNKLGKVIAKELVALVKEDDDLMDLISPPVLMDIEEASKYLCIPRGTVYQLSSSIPHVKVGKRLVFSQRDLIRWLNKKNKKFRG